MKIYQDRNENVHETRTTIIMSYKPSKGAKVSPCFYFTVSQQKFSILLINSPLKIAYLKHLSYLNFLNTQFLKITKTKKYELENSACIVKILNN